MASRCQCFSEEVDRVVDPVVVVDQVEVAVWVDPVAIGGQMVVT